MDVRVFAMGRNQSLTSFGIIAITDSIHVLPDAVMVSGSSLPHPLPPTLYSLCRLLAESQDECDVISSRMTSMFSCYSVVSMPSGFVRGQYAVKHIVEAYLQCGEYRRVVVHNEYCSVFCHRVLNVSLLSGISSFFLFLTVPEY